MYYCQLLWYSGLFYTCTYATAIENTLICDSLCPLMCCRKHKRKEWWTKSIYWVLFEIHCINHPAEVRPLPCTCLTLTVARMPMNSGGCLLVAAAHSYIIESYQSSLSFNPLTMPNVGTLILLYFANTYGINLYAIYRTYWAEMSWTYFYVVMMKGMICRYQIDADKEWSTSTADIDYSPHAFLKVLHTFAVFTARESG